MLKNQQKILKILKSDRTFFYGFGFVSAIIGVKVCDLIFYDENKLLKVR